MKRVYLSILAAVLMITNGCDDKPTVKAPELTTAEVSEITTSSAVAGGTITDAGTPAYSERGVCYATTENPTVNNTKIVVDGTGTDSFKANLNGLTANTTYYVRAYATTPSGDTYYGEQVSFSTLIAVKLLDTRTWEQYGDYYKYEYDAQNRFTKISYYYEGKLANTETFFYEGNELVKTEIKSEYEERTIEYLKNGNKITINDIGESMTFTSTIDLNNDGYPVKYEGISYSSLSYQTITYQYKDGNMIKEIREYHFYDYIYDDKKSPFFNCATPKWYMFLNFSEYNGFGNKNNVTEIIGEWGQESELSYEYDSDGFPTKITSTDGKNASSTLIYK